MKIDLALDPCSHCGACQSYCAWDAAEAAGAPAGPALCRDCQLCYRICPRLPHDRAALAAGRSPAGADGPWGRAVAARTASATEPPAGAQDSGITTRLAERLLAGGAVDAVLVTGRHNDWRPQPAWATDAAGVRAAAAGSKYSTSPALSVLRAGLERYHRVAVIALPCQAAALAACAAGVDWTERIALVIGLFCTESFAPAGLAAQVEARLGRPLATVERCDISRGRFTVQAGADSAEWRMKELHDIVWPICRGCADLTAELADVSIGSIGSGAGANTVLVRTPAGQAALEQGAGLWALSPLENAESLEKQCLRKRGLPAELPPDERAAYGAASVRGTWKRRRGRDLSC